VAGAGTDLGNYTITYTPGDTTAGSGGGTFVRTPAFLVITADDQSKTYGQTFSFTGTEFTTTGLVNQDTIDTVDLTSPGADAAATVAGSPYAIRGSNAQGTGLANYAITYVDGQLTIDPASPPITPPPITPPPVNPPSVDPSQGNLIDLAPSLWRFENGSMPLTPGDAAFRTTEREAPLAIVDPFALNYSLGEVVQLAPISQPSSEGFVPAAGGLDEGDAVAPCGGLVYLGGPIPAGCSQRTEPESFWSTRGEYVQ
jgi:hypothetical protein